MAPWRIPEHVLWQQVQDESVVLNLESGLYYALDDVATRMYAALETLGDEEDAVAKAILADLEG